MAEKMAAKAEKSGMKLLVKPFTAGWLVTRGLFRRNLPMDEAIAKENVGKVAVELNCEKPTFWKKRQAIRFIVKQAKKRLHELRRLYKF